MLAAVFSIGVLQSAYAAGNLIENGDLEQPSADGTAPEGWFRGRWGTNTAVFEYPVPSGDGTDAARVTLLSRSSGDAKWAYDRVPIEPGSTYRYSDSYSSGVSTYVTVEIEMDDGSFAYDDIGNPGATSGWESGSWEFVAPSGAVSARVFHLINQVGSLSIDDAQLEEIHDPADPPSPVPGNVVPNPSLEEAGSGGDPLSWRRGRYGSNTAVFTYPSPAHAGSTGAKVELTAHSSGDAKWYFEHVDASPGEEYAFSGYYRSDVPTHVNVQLIDGDGDDSYIVLGTAPASSSWRTFEAEFSVPAGTESLTIFHVIKSVGTLEIDDMSLVRTAAPDPVKFDKGYVSINFDDGWLSVYENALPILDAAGFRTDQFIITERLAAGNFPGYVKPAHVLDMQARGHRIGSHTKTHPRLAEVSQAQAREEIEESREILLDLGASPVSVLAYPEGSYNPAVQQMLRDAGYIAGRSSNGGQNDKLTDRYALRRFNLGNATTIAQVKAAIDQAIANRTWLILLGHEVNHSGRTYAITPEFLQQIVDYLEEKNIEPILVEEGIQMMGE